MSFWEAQWYGRKTANPVLSLISRLVRRVSKRRRQVIQQQIGDTGITTVVIGNITVGGTGKTPMIIHLAEHLIKQGRKPLVITRGYGGKGPFPLRVAFDSLTSQVGDEALLLKKSLPSLEVIAGPDRKKSIEMAETLGADVVLCDDGLQNTGLKRDIQICLIDGDRGLGNQHLLPAGPLREPEQCLTKFDFILSKGKPIKLQDHGWLPSFSLGKAVLTNAGGDICLPPEKAIVLSAIGNNEQFQQAVSRFGVAEVIPRGLRDHHVFDEVDFIGYENYPIIVTEKDWVKISQLNLKDSYQFFIFKVRVEMDVALEQRILDKISHCVNEKGQKNEL